MVSILLAFVLAAGAAIQAAADDDVYVTCLNSTAFQINVEVEDYLITTPPLVCPTGHVCNERKILPCTPAWNGKPNVSFECTQPGKFSDSDPCSSTFYLCINTVYHGFFKKNLTCGPFKTYNERKEKCEIKPQQCGNILPWRSAITSHQAAINSLPIPAIMVPSPTAQLVTASTTTPAIMVPSPTTQLVTASTTTPSLETSTPVTTTAALTTTPSTSTTTTTPISTTSTTPRITAPNPAPSPVFTCPHSGKFPVPNSCTEYYICRKIFWTLSHFKATCYGNLQFSSLKQKCVPQWLSDCGQANQQMPWWFQFKKDNDNSSEEDDHW